MRIIYLLCIISPLLAASFEASPTCSSPNPSFQCHKYSYLITLFKPETSPLEKTPSNVPLSNINKTSPKPPKNSNKFSNNSKAKPLERSRSFSKKQSFDIVGFFKNIPSTMSQYTYTFINKVKSTPKAVSDSMITGYIKFKDFVTRDIPGAVDRVIQKIKKLPDSLPKDFSGIEQTIKGIPQAISGNIKMLGEKINRMTTLKTVNGTTVLREKLNQISNTWTKWEHKISEKFKSMHNTVANSFKNMKERIMKTFQNLFSQIINTWVKIKGYILEFSIIKVTKNILLGLKAIGVPAIICSLAILGIFISMYKRNRRQQAPNPQ